MQFFTPAFREKFGAGEDYTDEDILSEINELAGKAEKALSDEEIQRLRSYEQQYLQIAPQLSDFQKWRESQSQATQQPAPKAVEQSSAAEDEDFEIPRPPAIPDHIGQMLHILRQNNLASQDPQTLLWKTSDPNYQGTVAQANEFIAKRLQFEEMFRRDPVGFYEKIALKKIREAEKQWAEKFQALEEWKARQEERLALQAADEQILGKYNEYFAVGEDGRQQPTPLGQLLQEEMEFLSEKVGVKDPQKLYALADERARAILASRAPSAPAAAASDRDAATLKSAEEQRKEKRRLFTNRVKENAANKKNGQPDPVQRNFPRSDRLTGQFGDEPPSFEDLWKEQEARLQ